MTIEVPMRTNWVEYETPRSHAQYAEDSGDDGRLYRQAKACPCFTCPRRADCCIVCHDFTLYVKGRKA